MNTSGKRKPMKNTRTLLEGLREALRDPSVRLLLMLTASFLMAGALVYSLVEGWGAVDSIYFATVTIATVGYGDFSPQTDIGKLFTVFYIIAGIGLFVALASAIADHLISRAKADLGFDRDKDRGER